MVAKRTAMGKWPQFFYHVYYYYSDLRLKLDLLIGFLGITFDDRFKDLILMIYTWVFKITIDVAMKKIIQLKQHFATTFRCLTQKKNGFSILEHFYRTLDHACTHFNNINFGSNVVKSSL
jgi:hypothetical protein